MSHPSRLIFLEIPAYPPSDITKWWDHPALVSPIASRLTCPGNTGMCSPTETQEVKKAPTSAKSVGALTIPAVGSFRSGANSSERNRNRS